MKISKKLVSFMLALAMMVTAMAVQTVPVQAKAKAIKVTNVKGNKVTIYQGDNLTLKTNYKASQLKFKTSDKTVATVSSRGAITAVKKGTAKITVAVKSNTKVKKTITVKVVNRYIIRKSDEGGNAVTEKYDRKTKKSTYTVEVKGKDVCNNVDMNIKYKFTSKDTHMAGTGFAGEINNAAEMNNDTSVMKIYNVTKAYDKEIIDFNKKSDKELYKYYELTKAEIKQTKFTHNNTDAGYAMASVVPHGKNGLVKECLIKDKETGTLYKLEYEGSEDPYAVYKSVKVVK